MISRRHRVPTQPGVCDYRCAAQRFGDWDNTSGAGGAGGRKALAVGQHAGKVVGCEGGAGGEGSAGEVVLAAKPVLVVKRCCWRRWNWR